MLLKLLTQKASKKVDNFYLSIIIPAYKEQKRIHKILDAILELQDKVDYNIETIVVLDGSPDKTIESAEKYHGRIRHLKIIDRKKNKGKGYTVKEGILAAIGQWILFADADNSTPIGQVKKLLERANGCQVIIGSRYTEEGKLAKPQPFYRVWGSRFLNKIIQVFAVPGIRDTQCGFKLFENKAAKEIFSHQTFDRWSFDIEILAIARHLGYKILEVGITWYDDPHSQVNPIKDGMRMVRDAWQVRKNMRMKLYDRV